MTYKGTGKYSNRDLKIFALGMPPLGKKRKGRGLSLLFTALLLGLGFVVLRASLRSPGVSFPFTSHQKNQKADKESRTVLSSLLIQELDSLAGAQCIFLF